jgi:hypothetical protein
MNSARRNVARIAEDADAIVLEQQMKWYRANVVWAYYEGMTPVVLQGQDGEQELAEPITAKQVRRMCALVDRYERRLREAGLSDEATKIRREVEAIDGEIIPVGRRTSHRSVFQRLRDTVRTCWT